MKNSRIKISLAARILLIITVITLTALPVLAAAYPKPKNNVADEAGVLSESTIRAIETANKTLELDTGTTIAVCTVDTTGESDIAEYARGVFKEWKLGEGVLLLIAKDDKNYYFVQSVGVESVLTNDVLKSIRDEYLEEDFEAGDINRGVNKCVTKLKNVLTAGITSANTSNNTTDAAAAEPTGTTFGSVVAGIFKTILWIVLIAVVLLVAFFVLAMYNEDAAALFRKYILRKPDNRRMPEEYYDERLYGDPRRRQNRNRLPQGQAQPRLRAPEDRYSQGENRCNYNSQPRRRPQNRQNGQYSQNPRPRNNAQYNGQGYNRNQNRQRSNSDRDGYSQSYQQNSYSQNNYSQNSYSDGSETRAFNIPTHNGQNQGR